VDLIGVGTFGGFESAIFEVMVEQLTKRSISSWNEVVEGVGIQGRVADSIFFIFYS